MALIHDNIEFHNAAALEPINGMQGLCPVRFPAALRPHMTPYSRTVPVDPAGIELRFVTDCRQTRIAFASHAGPVLLNVFCGDFHHSEVRIAPCSTHILQLEQPVWFQKVPETQLNHGGFDRKVWRIQFSFGIASYLGIETFGDAIRPPMCEEKPRLRYLAYGSSITHSFGWGYPYMTAMHLGVDLLNKGLSGSCHIEPATADFLADEEEWDFATLELGVNVRALLDSAEFDRRCRYLVKRLREAKPDAPLFLITHFTNRDHFSTAPDGETDRRSQIAFDDCLRAIAAEWHGSNVHLIEGRDVLTDFTGLSADLLHPSLKGHAHMGENLSRILRPLIPLAHSDGIE